MAGGIVVDLRESAGSSGSVDSVNGMTGNVVIMKGDIGLGNVLNLDQTDPSNIVQDSTHRFVSDAEKANWNALTGTSPYSSNLSLTLTGTNCVNLGNNFGFERTDAFTISGWFKPTAASGVQTLFSKMVSSTTPGWRLILNGARIEMYLYNTASTNMLRYQSATGYSIVAGQWFHIGMSYDGSSLGSGLRIFINGKLANTTLPATDTLTSSILNSADCLIGSLTTSFTNPFIGQVDECAIYDRALTQTEVVEVAMKYTTESIKGYGSADAIMGYWRCGEGDTSAVLYDQVGSYNGTLLGSPAFASDTPKPSDLRQLFRGRKHPLMGVELIETWSGGVAGVYGWLNTPFNSGTVTHSVVTTTGYPGAVVLSTSTSANAAPIIWLPSSCIFGEAVNYLPRYAWACEFEITLSNLSSASEEYKFFAGFRGSTGTSEPANGVYLMYDRTVSANWIAVVRVASVDTLRVDTGYVVSAIITQSVGVDVNAAGTTADFKVNGNTVYSFTGGLPTGNTQSCYPSAQIQKTVGTTARAVSIDLATIKSAT